LAIDQVYQDVGGDLGAQQPKADVVHNVFRYDDRLAVHFVDIFGDL
jgi:hypothetical protein